MFGFYASVSSTFILKRVSRYIEYLYLTLSSCIVWTLRCENMVMGKCVRHCANGDGRAYDTINTILSIELQKSGLRESKLLWFYILPAIFVEFRLQSDPIVIILLIFPLCNIAVSMYKWWTICLKEI